MARYFVGFSVPRSANRTISSIYPGDELRRLAAAKHIDEWTLPSDRHCTLTFLGDREDLWPVTEAVKKIAAIAPPFHVELASTTQLLGDGFIVAPLIGAESIARLLRTELGPPLCQAEELHQPFFGHITLARAATLSPPRFLIDRSISGSWSVPALEIFQSAETGARPKYKVSERFYLTGRLTQMTPDP